MTIGQALVLIGFLLLLLHDGFRVLFFLALGVVPGLGRNTRHAGVSCGR